VNEVEVSVVAGSKHTPVALNRQRADTGLYRAQRRTPARAPSSYPGIACRRSGRPHPRLPQCRQRAAGMTNVAQYEKFAKARSRRRWRR